MRVALIGLGTMGAPMARNLLGSGFALTVHNRTREREEPLASRGASRAATPAEAAREADIVITIVSDTPDAEEVLLGPVGVIEGARPGTLAVDMSTIAPDATGSIGSRLAERSLRFVDAPVSGGSEGAEGGTLTIMVGGETRDVEEARPVLDALGAKVTHVGPLGAGQLTKAVNQVIVGGTYLAVAEGLRLGMRADLDMDRVLEAIGAGACRSWVLEHRAGNILSDRYPLGFRLALHRKDLRIALDAAGRLGLELPLSMLVGRLEDELLEVGRGDEDVSVIAAALRDGTGL